MTSAKSDHPELRTKKERSEPGLGRCSVFPAPTVDHGADLRCPDLFRLIASGPRTSAREGAVNTECRPNTCFVMSAPRQRPRITTKKTRKLPGTCGKVARQTTHPAKFRANQASSEIAARLANTCQNVAPGAEIPPLSRPKVADVGERLAQPARFGTNNDRNPPTLANRDQHRQIAVFVWPIWAKQWANQNQPAVDNLDRCSPNFGQVWPNPVVFSHFRPSVC